MRPLRVAHVYNYLNPRVGGPPHVIAHLANAQRALGYEVTLISHDVMSAAVTQLLDEVCARPSERPAEHRGTLSALQRFPLSSSAFFSPSSQALRALIGTLDLVHLHSIWPTQCVSVARACCALKVPYLLSFHGHVRAEALAIKPLKKKLGLALGYREMIKGAVAYHALNESERDDARRFGVRGDIHVIPNGVALPLTSPSRAHLPPPLLTRLGDQPYVLFLSRLHPPKGVRDLALAFVQLAQRHPALNLVFAGRDEEGGAAQVREVIAAAGLEARVHVLDFVSGVHKAALFANAELFCLPSYHEGFSVAILEAMAARCPVLISEGCHFPQVERERLGWVHALGAQPLAEALDQAITAHDERHARAERAAQWVSASATWSQVAARFDQTYQEIIGSAAR